MRRHRRVLATLLCAGILLGLGSPAHADRERSGTRPRTKPAAGTAAAIRVLTTKRESARVIRYTVSTPSLAMSATTPLRVNVILPAGYARHPRHRYPVLYALPGTSNLANVWLSNLDTLSLTKSLPMIVVMPDGTYDADGGGFYTNWVDQTTSRGVANWETFHTAELVAWVDKRFRTKKKRSQRAIVGISQGGFGSMSYAARHPDLYGAAASFSGAVDIYYNEVCRAGAVTLISAIMTGLNQVQPFAPFGDPVTDAANWQARDPASQVARLANTKVDLYTSTGLPGESDLSDPAVPGTVAMEAILHASNLCFKQAAEAAGVGIGWHSYAQGTHAWGYGTRALKDYLPRLMAFFKKGR
ncbi:MAG: alpha/beta hydrolase family protein [Nocardioides sp.]|uniref:alpha/beta hydrolase n=1 Tax=Nocardioides sp. TaxID=35761 RepID=UPI0039E4CA1D